MKLCKKCGVEKPHTEFHRDRTRKDGLRYDCRECSKEKAKRWKAANPKKHQEAVRRWCAANPERVKEFARRKASKQRTLYPEKIKARNAVTHAIRDGHLIRQPCEICGAVPAEAHHEDYSKALDIRWLCQSHHHEAHQDSSKEIQE